jgi:hypothetical protein
MDPGEEVGNGMECVFELFGCLMDASGDNGLGTADPQFDPVGDVVPKVCCHG